MLAEANNQMGVDNGRLFVWLAALGRPAGRAATAQVEEDVTRLGAIARTDNAAVLKLIHDAGDAAIAEAQAALEEGDAGLLFAADDLDALLDDLFVFVDAALVIEAVAGQI